MQELNEFTVNINDKKIKCNKQLCKMSTFLNNLLFLGMNTFDLGIEQQQNSQEQQIYIELIDQPTFMRFVNFCQINDYKQPAILLPIKSNKLQNVLDQKNYHFISQYDYKSLELLKLKKAAQFLGCHSLQRVIAAKFACLIYFQDNKAAYQAKCKQLKVDPSISCFDDEKYKKMYGFCNS